MFSSLFSRIGCYGTSTKHVVEPIAILSTDNHTNSQNIHKESPTNSVPSNPLSYEDKSSSLALLSNPRTPTFVPNSGVLAIMSAQIALETVVYADTKIYIPNITCGKVVKVYDADTITVANRISVGGSQSDEVYRFQVRLNGIDSPEIKSKNPHTKELAKKARDVLSEMIFGKIVELKNVQLEKYGRLLADVYLGDLHLNQWLIDNNHAVRYDGGTKQIPEEWA